MHSLSHSSGRRSTNSTKVAAHAPSAPVRADGVSLLPPLPADGKRIESGDCDQPALSAPPKEVTPHHQAALQPLAAPSCDGLVYDDHNNIAEKLHNGTVDFTDSAGASTAAAQTLASQETWAARFDTALELRAAVTAEKDAQDNFEEALVQEVNLLRQNPSGYAAMFEREATLGYPFVCGEDEFFDTDAAAEVVHSYRPAILDAFAPKRSSVISVGTSHSYSISASGNGHHAGGRPVSATSTASGQTQGEEGSQRSASNANHHGGGSRGSRVRSARANNGNGGNATSPGDGPRRPRGGGGPSDLPLLPAAGGEQGGGDDHTVSGDGTTSRPGSPPLFRATLNSYGMTALNLNQLRTHFRRHQRHRTALESALKDIALTWQQAQQLQKDVWALEDEKATKKTKRSALSGGGGGASGGGSGGYGGNRSRSIAPLPGAHDEIFASRKAAMETLNATFAEQLRTVYAELETERETCRRAMEGANVLMDCVRALRDAQPASPLRYSRGLTLAARETSAAYHASAARVAAITETERIVLSRGCRAPTFSKESGGRIGADGRAGGPLTDAVCKVDASLGREDEATHTSVLLEVMLQQLSPGSRRCSGSTANHTRKSSRVGPQSCDVSAAAEILAALAIAPEYMCTEMEELTETARESCGMYGYVSGEVRGLQLYGVGSARALVMKALLGVAEPVFSFAEKVCGGGGKQGRDSGVCPDVTATAVAATATGQVKSLDVRLYEKSIFNPLNGQMLTAVDTSNPSSSLPTATHSHYNHGQHGASVSTASFYDKDLTAATAVLLCGELHPTTASAARHFTEHEMQQTTTAGRRAAQVCRRLGPLLWPSAHLIGCCWECVQAQHAVPTFDEALARRMGDGDAAGGYGEAALAGSEGGRRALVGTTLMVASGYEELDIVRKQGGNFGLASIRRVVQERRGANGDGNGGLTLTATERALEERRPYGLLDGAVSGGQKRGSDGRGSCVAAKGGNGKEFMSAVVDLHSALGVELLAPLTHPLFLPCTGAAATSAAVNAGVVDDGRTNVIVIAARADARRVQLQACVSTATSTESGIPRAPILDPEMVFVQRSPVDLNITLILVDANAVMQKLSREGQFTGGPKQALVHIYELAKEGAGVLGLQESPLTDSCAAAVERLPEKAGTTIATTATGGTVSKANGSGGMTAGSAEVSGYHHIGFIRLILDDAEERFKRNVSATTSQIAAVSETASTSHDSLALSPGFNASGAAQPPERRSTATAIASMKAGGWPTVTQDFADRCASILSPLRSYLPAAAEAEGADESGAAVRVVVQLPLTARSGYLSHQLTALRTQLSTLQVAQRQDDADDKEGEAGPPSGHSTPTEEPALLTAPDAEIPAQTPVNDTVNSKHIPKPPPSLAGKKGQDRKPMTTVAVPATVSGAASKKSVAGPGKGRSRTSSFRESSFRSSPSVGASGDGDDAALSPELQALLITPTEEFTAKHYFDLPYLKQTNLSTLQAAVVALTEASTACQARLQCAKDVLSGELTRIQEEMEKRKGRELLRLKHEENDITSQLTGAESSVAELTAAAAAAKDVLMKRIRNRALRVSRIAKLSAELTALEMEQSPPLARPDGASSPQQPQVLLWLCTPSRPSVSAADGNHTRKGRGRAAFSSSATPPPPALLLPPIPSNPSLASTAEAGLVRCRSPQPAAVVGDNPSDSTVSIKRDPVSHTYDIGHSYCIPLTPSLAADNASTSSTHSSGEVVEACFRIPAQFRGGRAVLIVNGVVNAAWRIL